MTPEELQAYEATQAEMRELGIPTATEVQAVVDETEVKTEEVIDETKQVLAEEVEKTEEKIDPKEYKDFKTKLREELQKDFDEKLGKIKEEMSKSNPNENKQDNLEEEAKKLALELNFDEAKTLALLKAARKGESLSEEDRLALNDLREMKEEREEMKMQQLVDQEWKDLAVTKQFPNATQEQLDQAKERMAELARSEKYLDKEMDYILYKERESFEKILFSPKQRTFESGRKPVDATVDEEFPTFRPDMTPAEFASFEKKREAFMNQSPREKMLLRTTDDAGRSVERYI